MNTEYLVEIKNIVMHFPFKKAFKNTVYVKAVDGISFSIKKGETLGLVGESGCGKTTTGRCILKLNQITSGKIRFRGKEISKINKKDFRSVRKDMQIIFQDPFASLDPMMHIGDIIGEPLLVHKICKNRNDGYRKKVYQLLNMVGLEESCFERFPHEFSGGQRQRISIARALATSPAFIVCDEAVSAFDVSTQAQIVSLLKELQKKLDLTYLFIAHDVSVVKNISNRIAVMYLGKLVEIIPSSDLYLNARHPYTQALMSAVPIPDPQLENNRERIKLEGDIPSPLNPPQGCYFHPRCSMTEDICALQKPELKQINNDHWVACHFVYDHK